MRKIKVRVLNPKSREKQKRFNDSLTIEVNEIYLSKAREEFVDLMISEFASCWSVNNAGSITLQLTDDQKNKLAKCWSFYDDLETCINIASFESVEPYTGTDIFNGMFDQEMQRLFLRRVRYTRVYKERFKE